MALTHGSNFSLTLEKSGFGGPEDRLTVELRRDWTDRLADSYQSIHFEIEAWCFQSDDKNRAVAIEVRTLVGDLNGRVLDESLLLNIAYHGFLVEMPTAGVQQLLAAAPPTLLLSDRVMFFRPQGQAVGAD